MTWYGKGDLNGQGNPGIITETITAVPGTDSEVEEAAVASARVFAELQVARGRWESACYDLKQISLA